MSPSSKTNFGRVVAISIVIAALIISATLFASSGTRQTVTTTKIETTTSTVTPSAEIEPNGSLLMSKTWGNWTFNLSMNSTSVKVGGALLASGGLTYDGLTNITIVKVDPIVDVSVYNSTGGMVWQFTPGGVIVGATVTPGETLGVDVCIPITTIALAPSAQDHNCQFAFNQQPLPGVYSIEVEPNFYSSTGNQDLGSDLQITANFTIF
jgi:hypothetical protein